MKKYFVIFMMLFPAALLASEFEEAFDLSAKGFERQASRVIAYLDNNAGLEKSQQKQEFEYISRTLKEKENEFAKNPVYWFVRGLNVKNQASFYRQAGDTSRVNAMLKDKDKFYLKAMALDKTHEPHLTARVYAAMKPGLPEKSKQQAIAAELGLGGSGESESYYWYLHWSNINELQKQGRMGEAQQALSNMKKELAESEQKNTFNELVVKIDSELKEKKSELSGSNKNLESVRNHKAFTEERVETEYYQYLLIIGFIMLVLIIIAVLIELRRRKKSS